ncbi:shikimate dehydrogenase [Fusibacter sp. 3D3]|uniref:shikimate dehydrogenase family protein n=1 Tax=Fusibacter sp. 3D3 TaxID=1048380 RepID=UPI00085343E8|nr:shikimate dehydrogenase [Fusibacter sp. 3D3]GAU78167.1 shikimate 5-dehydrogenase I alpha [Fusibacter sp. 3D3]
MRHYGLLGKGITYSISPRIHTYVYEQLSLDCDYKIVDGVLEEKLELLKQLDGFNVTIPYKQEIMPYLADQDEASRKIGAVNTVVKNAGKWFGYNTDYHGFKETLLSISNKIPESAVILGTGGAAKAVYHVLKDVGVKAIWIVSRKAKTSFENECCITYEMLENSEIQSDLLINCTPVGRAQDSPVSEQVVRRQKSVIDIIYVPTMTPLLKMAESLQIPYANGLMMLIVQALYADQLWFPDTSIQIQKLYQELKWIVE